MIRTDARERQLEFSLDAYAAILECANASGRAFVPFSTDPDSLPIRRIHLRHDVDYSPEMAVELARRNHAARVAGTFFFLLRGGAYNLFAPSVRRAVEEISGLGQSIGLHSVHIEAGGQSLEAQLASDFAAAQRVHPEMSAVFSWHNPTPDLLERAAGRPLEAGLVNVYAERFTRKIRYASDSNMRNRPSDFLELLRPDGPDALQLLLHPLYWVAGGSDMADVIAGTWPYLIQGVEAELLSNSWYHSHLPDGVGFSLGATFAQAWRQCASDRPG